MKYYLETNALYQIKRMPETILSNCFYSALSLIELVGGLTLEYFEKRKAILSNIINSGATFYRYLPEELIWTSFNYLLENGYLKAEKENSKQKAEDLIRLVKAIIISNSFDEFERSNTIITEKYDWDYFCKLDKHYSEQFRVATEKGNKEIKRILDEKGGEKVDFAGKEYDLDSKKALGSFFTELPEVNKATTIWAYSINTMKDFFETQSEKEEEAIYNSYNGKIDIYLDTFSRFTLDKIVESGNPSKNDFQDLLHLVYLQNSADIKIVSNDGLFKKYLPDRVISIEDLINTEIL